MAKKSTEPLISDNRYLGIEESSRKKVTSFEQSIRADERKKCAQICRDTGAYNESDEEQWCYECARRIEENS